MLRIFLLKISKSKLIAGFTRKNTILRRLNRRFVAGEALDDAITAVRQLNASGISATIDFLGENTTTEAGARKVHQVYVELMDRIVAEKIDANASLKLTQLGLDVNGKLCTDLLACLLQRAECCGCFVRIDMEGSAYTEHTIGMLKYFRARSTAIGAVIQAYLFRSEQDVADLLVQGCRIRLCKGAYFEPPHIAFPDKEDVDRNFIRLTRQLLASGIYHGIATHDPKMIAATIAYAEAERVSKDAFEFQMLYGIRRDLQQELVRKGYLVRVYVPYGKDWFPYFMRRLAERPANLWFLFRNMFRG